MKEIKAVIQTHKLHLIREALLELEDFPGMTVTQAEGCSPRNANAAQPLSIREQLTEFSPKVRLEIVADDPLVGDIVRCIRELTHTGQAGDGVVWVTPVEDFYRLRD